ncbi:MAG: arginine repressor [Oscillospiraceae bacterium]|nr:arginine repressor [Oscillospiraceae bacterium]
MKTKRQQEILSIIEGKDVETQDQLLAELRERGFQSTQATISRDIKELHLIKELTGYGTYKYVVSERRNSLNFAGRLRTIFKEGVTSFDVAQNIVVLKTMPGLAMAAGAAIDGMEIPELVGSLAGDDTVILIMRTNETALSFCNELHKMLK